MRIDHYLRETLADRLRKLGVERDPEAIPLDKPKLPEHGDIAATIALELARELRRPPRAIAEALVAEPFHPDYVESAEVAGPGFVNFRVSKVYLRRLVADIVAQGQSYGRSTWGHNRKVQLEFVSANPTGPLNVVSARAAAVGDVLANALAAVGFQVQREYYINDAGRQVRLLGMSVSSRYMALFGYDEPFPEEGYHGDYVRDLAAEIRDEFGDRFVHLPPEERHQELARLALEKMIRQHQEAMAAYRVHFDVWFRESELRRANAHLEVLEDFRRRGLAYEQDGAIWFRASQFGDEKDRVLVTREGEPTYFLVDIAYHRNKFARGFDLVYDFWGPDHHGYIPRMKAAIMALGIEPERFQVNIIQQVNLLRGGEVVKMSKRAGQIIEMAELIEEVGVDAARFFFLMRKMSAPLDFDIDLAKQQSEENPVYYVQYAHARICNILRFAEERGLRLPRQANLDRLQEPEELEVIKSLMDFPEVVSGVARFLEPHRLTTYLQELAATFHRFYHRHRVVGDDPELSAARLLLTEAVRIVLANGLRLINVSAPERM
ncbi:MAG: arginine--tRNA ligase [candidate division KSB1 bacterium]|nr:arginine--tRNA ligase [candidate division KSB1 bacterium]